MQKNLKMRKKVERTLLMLSTVVALTGAVAAHYGNSVESSFGLLLLSYGLKTASKNFRD